MVQSYLEALKSALRSLRSNKLRSFLTMLGVIIGTFAVIGLVSIVHGLKAEIKSEIIGLGAETLDMVPTETGKGGGFGPAGMLASFTKKEAEAVRQNATTLEYFTEIYEVPGRFSRGQKEEKSLLLGVNPSYFKIRNKKTTEGRLLTQSDEKRRAKVIVIGEGLEKSLFGGSSAIGKTLKANGETFEVVGVFEKETMKFGNIDINKAAYIPARTTEKGFPNAKIHEMVAKVRDGVSVEESEHEVEHILRKERKGKEFSVLTQKDMMDLLDRITGIISTALAGVASISLLVGGIGIMNIMLVSVTERTREIGLRKALGAENSDILAQFLIEAVVLCLVGGVLGVAVSEGVSFVLTKQTEIPSLIDLPTILAALGFSITVGLIFGTAPAIKAAKLDPIEALRHE